MRRRRKHGGYRPQHLGGTIWIDRGARKLISMMSIMPKSDLSGEQEPHNVPR